MGFNIFLFTLVFFGTVLLIKVKADCNVPPQFWCDDLQLQKECGVTEQCHKFKNSAVNAPVNMTLYYESLCPDCKMFFSGQFYPAYQKIGNIMNISLVPYGNARKSYNPYNKQWVFYCQHGQEECIGNLIETCAIKLLKNISTYFPFIECMERSQYYPKDAAVQCASTYRINIQPIIACSTSQLGNNYEYEMALRTEALQPPHQYVPWVTINGVHTEQIQNEAMSNLVQLICATYKGSPKPPACA